MEFAEEKKAHYILSVIFAFAELICGLVPYYIIGLIVEKLWRGERELSAFIPMCLIMLALWLAKALLHAASTTLSHIATFRVLANIRKNALDKLSRMPLGDVQFRQSGSLKNTLVERIDSIETTLAHVIPEFSSSIAGPIFMFIYLLTVDWRMALLSIVTLPIALFALSTMMKDADVWGKQAIEKTKTLNDTAVEYINGIEVIKVFGKAESSYENFVNAAKDAAGFFVNWMGHHIVPMAVGMGLTPATMIAVLPIGGLFVMKGSLDPVTFIRIIILSVGLLGPFITAMSYMDDISKVGLIVGEVADILTAPELIRPNTSKTVPNSNDIELSNVKFSYKNPNNENTKEVLHGINLFIKEGGMTALVGPSGSGKSTIARLIANLWDVDAGSVLIGGVDIKELSLKDYGAKIAYVSQDNYLFNVSVRENIRMGNKSANDDEVEQIAKQSGCHDFIMALENGYDTVVGDAGGHLSGGERQRISIARAMLKNAPIVILDEATAYTDPENEAVIQQSVARLVKGKTLIVIAHRLSTIKDADNIVVVKDGNIKAHGKHDELLNSCELYKSMWEAHISVKDNSLEGGALNA